MRRYFRVLIWIVLLLLVCAWYFPAFWYKSQQQLQRLKSETLFTSENIGMSIVYPLDTQGLKFEIPENSEKIRIITNAQIDKTASILPEAQWQYSLNYQLLAQDGSLLEQHDYHQRTRLTAYQKTGQAPYYANHYTNDKEIVLDGRMIILSLKNLKKAAFIQIRLQNYQPDIKAVALRIYVPVKISAHREGDLWRRLNLKQQEALAKGSVFPANLLSETEQINLLKHQWQPLGPMGIEGREYQSKTLYSFEEITEDKVEPLVFMAGLQADATHPAVIPIPEQGGSVSLELKMLDGSPIPDRIPLNLRWFGRTIEERWQKSEVWLKNNNRSFAVKGGLLEVRPSAVVVIKASLTSGTTEPVDITPEPLRIRTYFTEAGIDFEIGHLSTQATPLRVDVRRFFSPIPPQTTAQTTALEYQWLDEKQQLLHKGTLNITAPDSVYDHLLSITEVEKISDPESYYWLLPSQVRYLRFKSPSRNLLVNAYNQPIGLMPHTKVPEDAYVSLDKQTMQPNWFPLQPLNIQQLAIQQRLLWITGQYRPVEEKPETAAILAGNYLWTEYLPENIATAHYLLTLYDKPQIRDETLSSLYCELPKQRGFSLPLQAPNKLQNFAPDLWLFNSEKQPLDVTVNVDDKLLVRQTLLGSQAQLSLPNLTAGIHRFNLTPTGRWLLNNTPECRGARYLKQRVFKLQPRLSFIYQHKAQDELLSARLYTDASELRRSQIKIEIKAINAPVANPKTVFTNWTFKQRFYNIRPPQGENSVLLYTAKRFNSGENFFIPFNQDLPAGSYQVTITPDTATQMYLSLAQVVAGAYDLRRFYQEVQFEH